MQDINGVIINEAETLISVYTDDTFHILDGSGILLKKALGCFQTFIIKVSGLWFGKKKHSDRSTYLSKHET